MKLNNKNILIWLNSLGISNKNIERITGKYKDLEEFWYLGSKDMEALGISKKAREKIIGNRSKDNFYRALDRVSEYRIISIYDEDYPEKLMNIPNRPKVLYSKGQELRDQVSIAIVGSRKLTDYGRWACKKFTRELVELDVAIISGLALGMDSVAHREAIDAKGYTVGVLGNGIDIIYPKLNRNLYQDMEKSGTIVSEYYPETPPLPYNFPMRNRIISGLSDGIIIVEAKDRSGSLITAHHGLEQGKDIYAVPGNINSIFSSGTNRLIRDGAKPLLDIGDIIEEIDQLKSRILREKEDIEELKLSESELRVLKLLEKGPMHSDNIVYNTGIDISTVSTILIKMELKGYIEELSSNVFMKC